MTDRPKSPAKPGMSEVSAKFVDEAEAAAEAAALQKARDAIEAVLAKLSPQGKDETQIESVYRKVLALRENQPPRGCTDQEMAAWVDRHDSLEGAIGTLRAENLRDIEIKVAVLCDRLRENLPVDEPPANVDFIIAQSARDDLRRIAGESGAAKVAQPDTALSALWQEWQRACEANDKACEDVDNARSDETFAALMAVEDRIENTPARSVKGAATKLRVAKYWINIEYPDGASGEAKMCRKDRLTLSTLANLERLTGEDETEAAATAPPSSASVPSDPLMALGAQWQAAYDNWYETEPDGATNEEIQAQEENKVELGNIAWGIEDQAAEIPAQSIEGVLVQLRMAGSHYHLMERDGEEWHDKYAHLTWQAWDGLERLVGAVAPQDARLEVLAVDYYAAYEDPILVLKREWEARYKALDGQRDTGDDSDEARQPFFDRLRETEVKILRTQATTPAGIAVKLILWARLHCDADEVSGLSWTRKSIEGEPFDLDRLPVLSALLDLELMSQGIASSAIKELVADEPLLALERQWREATKALNEATPESPPKPSPDDMTSAISDAQEEMAATPARTIAGVLVKLRLYADLNSRPPGHPDDMSATGPVVSIDQLPLDNLELDETAVVGAMRDLERLAHFISPSTVTETPPAEDTALFAALAEYDRLVAISQDLELRKEVFRPGIPEADEANKAYEAAYDEAMAVWEKTRKIPATMQAGLFAKLQATIRFMTDLGQDELYEDEWSAIKADVQRIAGRDPDRLAGAGAATRPAVTAPAVTGEARLLIEQSPDRAVTDLESALTDLNSARQALGGFLEDHMQDHPRMETGYCILHTLDRAETRGRAAWQVLWEARPLKAGRAES